MNLFDYCVVIDKDEPCAITHYYVDGWYLVGSITSIHTPRYNFLCFKREGRWMIRFTLKDKRIRFYTGLTRSEALKQYYKYVEQHFSELL